jgi:hypothetical protein
MRLEHLCRITLQYTGDSSWQQPYVRPDGGSSEQEFGYGTGEGTVTGELLNGTLTWVNTPEHREDGVWMPDLRGFIKADDGGELLLGFQGLSIDGDWPEERRRAIVGQVRLITGHEPLRWLNTCHLVGEGEINARVLQWWIDAYVCVNDIVEYPPALGAQAPDRFRQGRHLSQVDEDAEYD